MSAQKSYTMYGYGLTTPSVIHNSTEWKQISATLYLNPDKSFELVGSGFCFHNKQEYYCLINTFKHTDGTYFLIKTLYNIYKDVPIYKTSLKYSIEYRNFEYHDVFNKSELKLFDFMLRGYTTIHREIEGYLKFETKTIQHI